MHQVLMVRIRMHFFLNCCLVVMVFVHLVLEYYIWTQYEDPMRQEAARKMVPIHELQEKALVSLAKVSFSIATLLSSFELLIKFPLVQVWLQGKIDLQFAYRFVTMVLY